MGPKSHDIQPPRLSATVPELADELRERLARTPERLILGVCGAPGAGKSTLAAHLAAELGPDVAVVVPFDGFHLAKELLAGTPLLERRGAIDTFDLGSYRALLHRLRVRDEPVVYAPAFDRTIEDPIASAIPVARDIPLVITEGNYLLDDHPDLVAARGLLDQVWYLQTPHHLRLAQLIARHVAFGKEPDAASAWAAGPDQRNAEHIEATRHLADRILTVQG